MTSSKSAKKSEIISEANNQDIISSLPTDLTNKILKRLPLSKVAKMSMLSRKWRRNCSSHRYLVFDNTFRKEQFPNGKLEWQKMNNIINNVLLLHNGPTHKFVLDLRGTRKHDGKSLMFCQWMSYLSRIGVKKIFIMLGYQDWQFPSHIYACKDLVKLKIQFGALSPPPTDFKGFDCLRYLQLILINFIDDAFRSLIAGLPRLAELKIINCGGIDNLVIDHVPTLENLTIKYINDHLVPMKSVAFKNLVCLKSISLILISLEYPTETVDSLKTLAASQCQLQHLEFGGRVSKYLAAGCYKYLLTLRFNHLQKLCLEHLDLGDYHVFCFTIGMLQCCPFIKDLEISVTDEETAVDEHIFNYDDNYRLGHLLKAKITGIKESSVGLKLIEYVLSISVVLEKLFFKCYESDPRLEVKVLRELLQLPRASPKAKLVNYNALLFSL